MSQQAYDSYSYDPTSDDLAGGAGPATMVSSTGQNDSSSVWGSGLLNTVQGWGGVAGELYSTFTGKNKPATNNNAAAPATAPATWQKYLPWVIGGAVVLIVIGLVMRK